MKMDIDTKFLNRKITQYGHSMVQCPICGAWHYNKPLQFERHYLNHKNGYLLKNGRVNDERNTKVREYNNRLRIERLEREIEEIKELLAI
jgi:hypothetical protein